MAAKSAGLKREYCTSISDAMRYTVWVRKLDFRARFASQMRCIRWLFAAPGGGIVRHSVIPAGNVLPSTDGHAVPLQGFLHGFGDPGENPTIFAVALRRQRP